MASFKNSLNRLGESISRGVTHSMESMKDGLGHHGRTASRDAPRYSKGVRELNDQGYEVYNIGDDSEIFISRIPDKALFDDGDPVLVSGDDVFVGKVDEPEPAWEAPVEAPQVNAMSFFANVPRGSSEVEIRGTVGVNNGGRIESAEAPVNVRQGPVVSFEAVEAVCDAPAEAPVRQASAEAPLQEAPAEAPSNETVKIPDFMNRIRSGARPAPKSAQGVPVEAPAEESVEAIPVESPVEVPACEVPVEAPVEEPVEIAPVEVPVEPTPVESPVEVSACEVPVEAPVEGPVEIAPVEVPVEPTPVESLAKVHEEFFIDVEEVPAEGAPVEAVEDDGDYNWMFEDEESVESPAVEEAVPAIAVESPVADDVDVDAVVAQIVAEEVAKQVAVAQIADTMVVRPSMPMSSLVVEELSVTEESSVVGASAIVEPSSVSTSAEAEAHVKPTTFDADGEALPPIADPVVKRPRSMRFRFTNGVLMNVDKEPKEELQGPLD